MSSFRMATSKLLLLSLVLVGFASQAQAGNDNSADAEELYSFLFPAEKSAETRNQAETVDEVQPAEKTLSAFAQDNRRGAWSSAQIESMRGAFKKLPPQPQAPLMNLEPESAAVSAADIKELDKSPYADLVKRYALKRGLDPMLVHQVIVQESRYNPNAVSPKGAKGLMQLMDSLSQQFNIDPFDPESNINVGTQYLAELLAKYKSQDLALAAYNAGPGAVDKYLGVPPYAETQNYVSSIKAGMARMEASNL